MFEHARRLRLAEAHQPLAEPLRRRARSRRRRAVPRSRRRHVRSRRVPTGTPAGICTIDSSESMPFSAFDSTGTPNTGRWVFAAVMPGRCAAPPAPATITLSPRAAARRGVLEEQVRRAVRAHDLRLGGHAELVERLHRVTHRFPVASGPHDHAHHRLRPSCAQSRTPLGAGSPRRFFRRELSASTTRRRSRSSRSLARSAVSPHRSARCS